MTKYKHKPKKDSMIEIINKYSNNEDVCIEFFFNIKWPPGFYCERCRCTYCYSIQRHQSLHIRNMLDYIRKSFPINSKKLSNFLEFFMQYFSTCS